MGVIYEFSDIKQMEENAYQFFLANYTTEHTYNAIMQHVNMCFVDL